jgi:hypothetical protein
MLLADIRASVASAFRCAADLGQLNVTVFARAGIDHSLCQGREV